ncbi:MAG: DNA-binding protein [Marinilabiliales bacterium]|nr:MAG: DNA-binding protein [Marinilabiliales bacterium]
MEKSNHNTEALEDIQKRLEKLVLKIRISQKNDPDQMFLDNQEFIQIMNISKRTAQEWRSQNIIGYSQVGKKFYYRLSDIIDLLKKFYNPSNP